MQIEIDKHLPTHAFNKDLVVHVYSDERGVIHISEYFAKLVAANPSAIPSELSQYVSNRKNKNIDIQHG